MTVITQNDIGDIERNQLASSERTTEPDEQQRAIAETNQVRAHRGESPDKLSREQWYLKQWGSVKGQAGKLSARRRFTPLPSLLVEALRELRATSKFTDADDPAFAGESGRPVDQQAMLRRQVRKAAQAIGVPKLGWHDLRRTFATLADQLGMSLCERKALMGHAHAAMTL